MELSWHAEFSAPFFFCFITFQSKFTSFAWVSRTDFSHISTSPKAWFSTDRGMNESKNENEFESESFWTKVYSALCSFSLHLWRRNLLKQRRRFYYIMELPHPMKELFLALLFSPYTNQPTFLGQHSFENVIWLLSEISPLHSSKLYITTTSF